MSVCVCMARCVCVYVWIGVCMGRCVCVFWGRGVSVLQHY